MNILVFAAGPLPDKLSREDLPPGEIFCADGGAAYAYRLGIVPRLIVGDFDSLDNTILEKLSKKGAVVERYPQQKDYSDLELLMEKALLLKPDCIHLWGVMGGRWDHSITNIQMLENYSRRGITCHVYTKDTELIFLHGPKEIYLKNRKGKIISLIPLGQILQGVSLEGFLYPLKNADLHWGKTLSISNTASDNNCRISFQKGSLLIVLNNQTDISNGAGL